jgi:tetratricopeptide (TPR) repeat protein
MSRQTAFFFLFSLFLPVPVLADTWLIVPFFNQTGKANLDWIGESVAESIHEALSRQGSMVVPREDRGEGERRLALRSNAVWTRGSILKLAEALDAQHVIFGTYELVAETGGSESLRIRAEAINVRDLRPHGKASASGPLENLFNLQSNLAWQMVRQSNPKSAPSEEQFQQSNLRIRLDALENYVRGLIAPNEATRERYLQQALKLDARYSQAAFQLGKLLHSKEDFKGAAALLDKVQPWDPHYREAGFLLGLARFQAGEFRLAEAAFQRVVREVPLSEVWNNLAATQLHLNQPEALENFRRALEGDDKDPVYHFNLGLAYMLRGAYPDAIEQFRATLDRDPNDTLATKLLGRCLRQGSAAVQRDDLVGMERLKLDFEEAAYMQLKALIGTGKN